MEIRRTLGIQFIIDVVHSTHHRFRRHESAAVIENKGTAIIVLVRRVLKAFPNLNVHLWHLAWIQVVEEAWMLSDLDQSSFTEGSLHDQI